MECIRFIKELMVQREVAFRDIVSGISQDLQESGVVSLEYLGQANGALQSLLVHLTDTDLAITNVLLSDTVEDAESVVEGFRSLAVA